jgi:hypothetical protein
MLIPSRESRLADQWFEDLRRYVHPLINQGLPGEKVRIAILDTGINPSHELIRQHWTPNDRNYESFIDGLTAEDIDGHGTQVAHALIKTAPNSEIFVARVFENRAIDDCGIERVRRVRPHS